MSTTRTARPTSGTDGRRLLLPLAVTFVVLDVAALALLGPISPSDTPADVATLYGDRSAQVLVSRLVHGLGLSVAFGFAGLLAGRLRELEAHQAGTLTRIVFGGLVALVPIEVVRNVVFAALALRHEDFGSATLPLHVIAVILGPAIAVPVTAAMVALAVLLKSRLVAVVALAWLLSGVRLATLSTIVWYAGLAAVVGLLVVLLVLATWLGTGGIITPPTRRRG